MFSDYFIKIMKESYIQSFQYKSLNRMLIYNNNIHRWALKIPHFVVTVEKFIPQNITFLSVERVFNIGIATRVGYLKSYR